MTFRTSRKIDKVTEMSVFGGEGDTAETGVTFAKGASSLQNESVLGAGAGAACTLRASHSAPRGSSWGLVPHSAGPGGGWGLSCREQDVEEPLTPERASPVFWSGLTGRLQAAVPAVTGQLSKERSKA